MSQDDSYQAPDPARREMLAVAAVAGLAVAAGEAAAASKARVSDIVTTDVSIKTSDGECDAAFLHPARGSYPGVIIWTDIFGLRPAMRAIGARLAAEGYAVLVPNPFYRTSRGLVVQDATLFNFTDPAQAAKMRAWSASIQQPGAGARDTDAFISFLDAQRAVNRAKKIGTQGYCMGGPLIVASAAQAPDRIGAAASFHGGGLVTDKPESPHLLAPRIKAHMYFGIAASDDARQPDAKTKLKEAFGALAEVEVYPNTIHGWCVSDMPQQDGKPIYSQPDAERAWSKLLALYLNYLV